MRVTIDLKDEHRAKLLHLAAIRGESGISVLIAEAVERYLSDLGEPDPSRLAALGLRGCLSDEEADEMRAAASGLRRHWR